MRFSFILSSEGDVDENECRGCSFGMEKVR